LPPSHTIVDGWRLLFVGANNHFQAAVLFDNTNPLNLNLFKFLLLWMPHKRKSNELGGDIKL
jgi:hypothetical protein